MSEDKMRELIDAEISAYYKDEYASRVSAESRLEAFGKACAAIKDAEIAELKDELAIESANGSHWASVYRQWVETDATARAVIAKDQIITDQQREIAELTKEAVNAKDYMVKLSRTVTEQREAIASRDLMIKEFIARLSTIKSLYKRMIAEWEADNYLHQDTCDELDKAIAKSEHHNSRALEKMLLEARIDELLDTEERYQSSVRLAELLTQLNELNKE